MSTQPQAYRLLRDREIGGTQYASAGDTVYALHASDYGSASDDTRINGQEYCSVTLNSDGSYPFFTVPVADLEELVPTASITADKWMEHAHDLRQRLVLVAACANAYPAPPAGQLHGGWSDDFVRKELGEAVQVSRALMVRDLQGLDWKINLYRRTSEWAALAAGPGLPAPTMLSKAQLRSLGFHPWDDPIPGTTDQLWLIPLWLVSQLDDSLEVHCIDGIKKMLLRDEPDLDHRGGCIAWGFVFTPVSG